MKIMRLVKIFLIFFTIAISAQMISGQSALVLPKNIFLFYHGEGKNIKDKALTPDMIEWLEKALDKEGGMRFDQIIKDYLLNAINGCVSESWREIRMCPFLDKYKDSFSKKFNKTYVIQFSPFIQGMITDYVGGFIGCDTEYLKAFLNDIGKQILEGKTPNVDPVRYPDFVDDFAHELLHYFGGIGGSQKDECEAHCLTKKCFNSNHDPRNYTYFGGGGKTLQCQNEKFDEQTRQIMGEGGCFCGVDWTPDDGIDNCCKTNAPKSASSGPKSSTDSCEQSPPDGGDDDWKPDHGDDNYSYASGNAGVFPSKGVDSFLGFSGLSGSLDTVFNDFRYSFYPDVLIYNKFGIDEMERLLNRSEAENFIDDYEHMNFFNAHKVLIVPSGELMGEKDSALIGQAFQRFVGNGGTLLVFGQQYGADVERLIPVPAGEPLKLYGWREDQSCWSASAYLNVVHPAISSWVTFWTQFGSFITDGYIDAYPKNSTVLLKRTRNQKPFLLFYPYGDGTVILTSMFTDWTYAHSQATGLEVNIIRDLITFAKNPRRDIPIYDLHRVPYPDIHLNANLRNNTEGTAAKVKFTVCNPSRKKVLYQYESGISLNSGGETEVPLAFRLQNSNDYGICHTDYELYDAENNLLQPASESDGFAA